MPQSPTVPGLSGSKRKSKLIYRIKNGFIYTITDQSDWQQVKLFPTESWEPGPELPRRFIVLQSTCSPLTAYGYAQWMQTTNSSVHLCIDTDGSVCQMVQFNYSAKHSTDVQYAGYPDLNQISFGIALVNPGPLTITADGGFVSWWGSKFDPQDVVVGPHPNNSSGEKYGWVPYTPAQMSALMAVCKQLQQNFKTLGGCVGLDSVNPHGCQTPGLSISETGYQMVNTVSCNKTLVWTVSGVCAGHAAPDSSSTIIVQLNTNTKIKPVRQSGGWTFVLTPDNQEVWVHNNNLTTRS